MKITMKTSKTMKAFFDDFIIAKKAQGLADKTIKSYQSQFRAINNHLDVNVPIEDITKSDLEKMVSSDLYGFIFKFVIPSSLHQDKNTLKMRT